MSQLPQVASCPSFITSQNKRWEYLSDARRKPPKSACVYRVMY